MLSLQDEVCKRKFELALMELELASMEDRSISPGYAANILQDQPVSMLTEGRPVRSGTIRPIPREALQSSLLGELPFDSRKVIDTFCPIGIRDADVKYHTQYGKYWWNEHEQHGDSIPQTVPDQILKEHIEHPDMCIEQEQDAQLSFTGVTSISSQAATQVSEGCCRINSNQNLDTVVSDLVDTITMQLSSLDANQAERIATDNPAVFTPQIRRKLAAEMDMDPVNLHDKVHNHPNSSQAKPLVRCSLRDVSNVLKTSRQQHRPESPLAQDRISFKIQPWMSGAAALLHSVSTNGGRPREN
jgi:hypothetical protein